VSYRVEYTDPAFAELRQLDRAIARRISRNCCDSARTRTPRHYGADTPPGIRRLGVADYRLFNEVRDVFVVMVIKVGHRSTVYRK